MGPLKTVEFCEHLEILLFTFPLRFLSQAETKAFWDFVERFGEELMGVGIHLAQA